MKPVIRIVAEADFLGEDGKMSLKSKIAVILGCVFIFSAGVNKLYAAWWDKTDLSVPVPPGTEEVSKEARKILNSEIEVSYYKSNLSIEEIRSFYLSRLPNLGWREKEFLKPDNQRPDMNLDYTGNEVLGQNLVFEDNNGQMLIIIFIPGGVLSDARTSFSIQRGKIDISRVDLPETGLVSELVAKPKKDVVSTYPQSSLMTLSETERFQKATYFSKDDIDAVSGFYKRDMRRYGWFLVNEHLPRKIKQDLGKDDCPDCEEGDNAPVSIEVWISELFFANKKGDKCNIILSRIISDASLPENLDVTTIVVDYEKKEK